MGAVLLLGAIVVGQKDQQRQKDENAQLKLQVYDIQTVISRIEKLEAMLNEKEKVQVSRN